MRLRSRQTRPDGDPHSAGAAGPAGFWGRTGLLLRMVAIGVATALLAFWIELSVVAFLPAVLGFKPVAIRSGSMAPALSVGDVILTRPIDEPVGQGDIITFSQPGDPSMVTHRVVARNADGTYLTRGDANPANDSTPVPPSAVQSRAVLIVPWVGLPVVWVHAANWTALAGGAGLVVLLLMVATISGDRPRGGADDDSAPVDPPTPDSAVTGPPKDHERPPSPRPTLPVPGRVLLGVPIVALASSAGRRT